MKRLTFSALLLSAVIMCSLAQPPRGGRPGGPRGMMEPDSLKKELNLTDDQVAKLKTLNEEFRSQMKENKEASREDMKASFDKHQAAIKAVLTSEQYEKLTKMRDERMKNRRDKKDK